MEKEDFGILMVTHGGLAKGYLSALKLVLDIDETRFRTQLCFEERRKHMRSLNSV